MRKAILNLIVGTIVLMFVSCSADEPIAINTLDGAISYTVVAANQTRAAHLSYCNQNKPNKFKVWAIHQKEGIDDTNNLYIDGDIINKQPENNYAGDETRYWPSEGNLSFYAVVDGAETNSADTGEFEYSNGTASVKNYTIPTETYQQLDLMYAVRMNQTYKPNTDNDVQLNFRHALSQICFMAENENSKSIIKIHKISVKNVQSKGTYNLPSLSTEGVHDIHSNSSSEPQQGQWNNLSETKTYTIELDQDVKKENSSTNLSNYDNHQETVDDNIHKVLNLLPQTSTNTVEFELILSIFNENGVKTLYDNKTYTIPVDIDWKEGFRYIYTFKFLKDWDPDQYGIKYTVNIDDFNDSPLEINLINGHEAVLMRNAQDPQGALYFATTNIDANTPYDTGKYFWWGNITGYTREEAKNQCPYMINDVSTYKLSQQKLEEEGFLLKGTETLVPSKDAASQKWGLPWRMPTKEELEWLIDTNNCGWKPVKKEERLIGYKVTSHNTNKSIFLPVTSYIEAKQGHDLGQGWISDHPHDYYWSSTVNSGNNERAVRLHIAKNGTTKQVAGEGFRYDGFVIRPVATPITTGSN